MNTNNEQVGEVGKLGRRVTRVKTCQYVSRKGRKCSTKTAKELCYAHERMKQKGPTTIGRPRAANQCVFITRKGTQCNVSTDGKYCSLHNYRIRIEERARTQTQFTDESVQTDFATDS